MHQPRRKNVYKADFAKEFKGIKKGKDDNHAQFGCGRTKTQAILKGVLAPYSVECLLKELASQPFSISTDASNHKEIKLFPLVIRFFTAAKGVQGIRMSYSTK